jgi:hypothetical protein
MTDTDTEQVAAAVARAAADIDGAARRTARAAVQLERLGAEPNVVLAARDAVEHLSAAAADLRRNGLLTLDQQRLL